MKTRSARILATSCVLALLGCQRSSPTTATEDPTRPVTPIAPTSTPAPSPSPSPLPSPSPSPSPSSGIPPMDTSCKVDADCVVFEEATTGKYACCPFGNGCVLQVANDASRKALRAACKAHPANECPPIGCAQPASPKAKCDAGTCVLAK